LILTDGIITDMHQTCEAIVNVSIVLTFFALLSLAVVVSVHYAVLIIITTLNFNGHFPGGAGLAGTRMSLFWIC